MVSPFPVELIPGWTDWSSQGIDALISYEIDLRLAAIASRLFWPAFYWNEEGALLLDGIPSSTYQHWLLHFKGEVAAAESMCNRRRLTSLIFDSTPPISSDGLQALGAIMRETWQAAVDVFTAKPRQYIVFGDYDEHADEFILTIVRHKPVSVSYKNSSAHISKNTSE